MAGVRIRHDSLRHGTLAVEHPTKPYKVPYLCPKCQIVHKNKVIHVYLDNEGYGIVSVEVLELLRQSGMPGLTYENVVENPPTQGITVDPNVKPAERDTARVTPYQYDGTFKRLHVLKNRLFLTKGNPNG
jgi:hypothetical protein